MKLARYLMDGAHWQARAVLAVVQGLMGEGIEDSWNKEYHRYMVEPSVGRWENCREQGYVISLYVGAEQLNIAFFEHRNSDMIHALKWTQYSINTLTIDTAEFGELYKTKYDTSFSVPYGEFLAMGEWIEKQFLEFYNQHKDDNKG